LIIVLDQALKYLTITNKNPFTDSFICNSGISFGLSLNLVLFWFFWFLALFVLSFLVKKFKNFFLLLALAGALSNLIDRLLLGCVIDYISILNFPVFNLADFFISFGFLAFLVFFKK
jgi:signal peptidase II